MHPLRTTIFGALAVALGPMAVLRAQVSISNSATYTQNFNTLAAAAANTFWVDNSTIAGWYAAGDTTYDSLADVVTTGNNTKNTPRGLYSFGLANSADRALGSFNLNGGADLMYGVQLRNDTRSVITSFTVTLVAEKYQPSGGNDTVNATYLIGASGLLDTAAWTPATSLNINGTIAGHIKNSASVGTALTFTASTLDWAPNTSLWIRWVNNVTNGNDRGLGIDDFTFTATGFAPVPEPSTYALLLGAGTLGVLALRRLRKQS